MKDKELFLKELERLNPEQRKAVETIEGPVMVVAGPGTGKTQMLALRIANILNQPDNKPENILCLTFTEAGASAMRDRLKRFIGTDAYKITIETFHSFANNVILKFPEKFTLSSNAKQLDEIRRIKIIRELIETTEGLDLLRPFYNKFAKEGVILSGISELKKEGLNPEEFLERIKEEEKLHDENIRINKKTGKPIGAWQTKKDKFIKMHELYLIYKTYSEYLTREELYDYEDMILFVGDQLENDSDLLQHYQEQYQFILVDEFQDTNGGQNLIINLIAGSETGRNIFVVGDDDQAIYRFQGANLDNIMGFTNVFNETTHIVTKTNYRSNQAILDIADSLINENENRLSKMIPNLEKKLKAFFKADEEYSAEEFIFNNSNEENVFIAKKILELQESGVDLSDIAVIYRKNAIGDKIADVLSKFGLSNKRDNSKQLLENDYISRIIEILYSLDAFDKLSNERLYRLMLFDFFEIPTHLAYRLTNDTYKNKESLTENIFRIQEEPENFDESLVKFSANFIKWHKQSANITISELYLNIINDAGILDYLKKSEDKKFEDLLAINNFYDYLRSYEKINSNTLKDFLNDLEIVKEMKFSIPIQDNNPEIETVNLLTAHSSKGLEFEHVFIINCTENNWGKTRAMEKLVIPEITNLNYDEEQEKLYRLEDERRLFFVAITRARKKVYFTYSKQYEENGNISTPRESQFLNEIDRNLIKTHKEDEHEMSFEDGITLLQKVELKNYSEEEKQFLREQLKKFRLSPSALNTYLRDPEEFKENYLIKIPGVTSKELALGTSIHAALEYFNKTQMKESKFINISLDQLTKIFSDKLYDEFNFSEEYEDTLNEGKRILSKYYESELTKEKYIKPIFSEYSFARNNIVLDIPNGEDILLTGKIDKVEMIDESENLIRIVDYKTAKQKSENMIKGLTSGGTGDEWRQLVFYKLLSELDNTFRVDRNINKPKLITQEVELNYLKDDKGKYVNRTFNVSSEDIGELKDVIREVMREIREGIR